MPKHYNPHSQKPISRLKQLRKMGNRELEAEMLLANVDIWFTTTPRYVSGQWCTVYGPATTKRQCMVRALFARWKGEEGADAGVTVEESLKNWSSDVRKAC